MENYSQVPAENESAMDRLKWIVGLNLILIVLALATAWLGFRSYALTARGAVTEATVVRLSEDGLEFDAPFSPVFEFQVDGQTYTVRSQNSYRWWNRYLRFPIGRQIEVRYDASDPGTAEINSWWDIWGEAILLGVVTVLFGLGANAYLRFRWRAQGPA